MGANSVKWVGGALVAAALWLMIGLLGAPLLADGTSVIIRGVPAVEQLHNLSCEYAAASVVTQFWGNKIPERTFIREVPLHPNPHHGFRGNIDGPAGGLTDYGVYAEPLVPVLERHGFDASVYYNDTERLKANLRSGNPVVVWITVGRAEARPLYTRIYQEEVFRLVPWEHAVVVYGYDGGGVRMMDVGDGNYYYTDWASFLRRWNYFNRMALVITPH